MSTPQQYWGGKVWSYLNKSCTVASSTELRHCSLLVLGQ